ncbi:fcbf5382-09f1-4f9d-8ddd-78b4e62aaaaa [Sclerotinia trifoliorum]|uniref:Fcbf5382-09f1-4f9d-8ddd-78b4e62aaaaa n=1 Tax=Sclerotinia trifoliorum TaxID=28548 RepID=A0A8H2VRU0_9HELO|nr:fcbf5382-09f1-4f9d-8ddd-78b4e62aaaaa [Sclerotinia trifoliorum]
MSASPMSPLLSGLGVLTAAAVSQGKGQIPAVDHRKAEIKNTERKSVASTQQLKRRSGSADGNENGSKLDITNMTHTSRHITPPPNEPRDEFEMSNDASFSDPHSPLYVQPTLKEKLNTACAYEHKHLIGRFCFHCRHMEMPWGDDLPIAVDDSGTEIRKAPQGSLLEGIKDLAEPFEISQLAIFIEFRTILQDLNTLPGLAESLRFFPNLHEVASRITGLTKELETLVDESEREQLPHWFNNLHELLKDPTLTHDQYLTRVAQEWSLRPTNEGICRVKSKAPESDSFRISTGVFTKPLVTLTREDAIKNDIEIHNEAEVDELINHLDRNESRGPGYVQFTLDFVNWLRGGAHNTGHDAPQWGPHYAKEFYDLHYPAHAEVHNTNNNLSCSSGRLDFSRRQNSAPTTPRCNEEDSDVEVYDSNDDEAELEGAYFKKLPEVKKNTPGRANVKWRFVEGTDIENAELGKPDPSKFYLTRQNVDDPLEIDLRQYAQIAGFNWDDPTHIRRLNKARAQNRKRTHGNIAETRIPWTQMEKICLEEEVRDAIKAGFDRRTMNWDEIAIRLKERFEGVLQPKGSKLAPGVERETKDGKKDKTLKTTRSDRTGYNRSGSATETQAMKYSDILELINKATGLGGKGGRGIIRGPRRNVSEMMDGEQNEEDNRPKKKLKTLTRHFSASPPPRTIDKYYDDDKDKLSPPPTSAPGLKSAFSLKFGKSNAKEFVAKSDRI